MHRPAGGAYRLATLLLPFMAAGGLAGQSPERVPLEAVLDVGFTRSAAVGFSEDQICTSGTAWSFGARLRRRLSRWVAVEAASQIFVSLETQHCYDGFLPPPPPTGPFALHYSFYGTDIVGYPFGSTGVRLQLVPLSRAGVELRAWGGVDRLWAKHINVPHAGLVTTWGHHGTRTLLEVDAWWYHVPQHQATENYQDGVLISREDRVIQVRARTLVVRAGVAVSLGRAIP